jgi:hypothetical protein
MQREVDEAASVFDRAEGNVGVSRRRVLGGMMALAATATSPARANAACRCPSDAAMFYLYRRFELAAKAIAANSGEEQIRSYKQMTAYANAMALIPAHTEQAIETKRAASRWVFCDGPFKMSLPFQVVKDLTASADRDA